MKILKYILAVLLLLTVIFIALGFITPSISYESEIIVNKTAKESWAVMTDESKLSQWIQGFQKTELVSGTANTPGAISNVYVVDGGKEMIMKETIKEIYPNEKITMNFNADDFMLMDYTMLFTETDGKTVIKSQTITTGQGMFAKSMVALMKNTMISQEDVNMANLKKLIEENTTDYFPVVEESVVDSIQ